MLILRSKSVKKNKFLISKQHIDLCNHTNKKENNKYKTININ